jgi:malonyl CoA-acyl carrier protein transacylase
MTTLTTSTNSPPADGARAVEEFPERPAGSPTTPEWETELFLLQGADRSHLVGRAAALSRFLAEHPDTVLKDLAFSLNTEPPTGPSRLALVAGSVAELRSRLARACERLAEPQCRQVKDLLGIYYVDQPLHPEGRLAFLFPGEGAQYPNMLGDLFAPFPEVRAFIEHCDRLAAEAGREGLSRLLYLPADADADTRARAEQARRRLGNAMCSVLMADWAMARLLGQLGLEPYAMAGHSMGELAALGVAGCVEIDARWLGQVAATLDDLQRQEEGGDAAAVVLLAVGAGRATAAEVMRQQGGPSGYLAMDNCPHQTVLIGLPNAMAAVEAEFRARQVVCERLPFRRPYHTPLFQPFLGPLDQMFEGATFRPPQTRVYSCTTGRPFPADPAAIRRLAVDHWASPVEFTAMIEAMYADGVRLFVEAGPRGNLSAFVEDILRGRPFAALPANVQRRSGLTQLQHMAAQLSAHHVPLKLEPFYCRRDPRPVAWETRPAKVSVPTPAAAEKPLALHQRARSRGAVVAQYLGVMEQFLEVQRTVVENYLARRRSPSHPLPDPSDGKDDHAPAAARPPVKAGPLIGEIVEHVPGRELLMRRPLDLGEDLYAGDHTLGGRNVSNVDPHQHGLPVMPMTFSLEMMAEVAALLLPGKTVIALKDVRLLRWLPFDEDDPPRVEAFGRILPESPAGAGTRQVRVEIRDLGNTARPGTPKLVAAAGTVVLADDYPEPPLAGPFPLTNERPCRVTPAILYRNLFHGPLFHGVIATERCGDEGIEGRVRVLSRSGWFRSIRNPEVVLDPVLTDVAMHLLGCWHLEQPDQTGRILLPFELGGLELYGPPPEVGTELTSRGRTEQESPRHVVHGVDVLGADGRLRFRLTRAGYWRFYLPFGHVNFFGPKDEYFLSKDWPAALPPAGAGPARCLRLEPPADLLQAVVRSATARLALTATELRRFRAWNGTEQQLNDDLFDRIVAKDAVRSAWRDRHGERLFPADIEIETDGHGRAVARRRNGSDAELFPAVALARAGNLVVALAAFRARVGLAVERIGAQAPAFEETAFDPGERQLLECFGDRAEAVSRLWAAKGALAQALGKEGPRAIRAREVDPVSGFVRAVAPPAPSASEGKNPPSLVHRVGPEEAALTVWTARDGDLVAAVTFAEGEPA